MSGGSYEYKYGNLNDLADMLSPSFDEHQKIRDCLANALREMAQICHDVEWIDSGDYGQEEWDGVDDWLIKHNFIPPTPGSK